MAQFLFQIVLLFGGIITSCHANPETSILTNTYTSSGFLHGNINDNNNAKTKQKVTMKIKSYHHDPITVQSIQFDYVPKSLKLKSNVFHILPNKFSYDRPIWSNGQESIYFIVNPSDKNAPYGTWLVGKEIGVDSGYAFFKPQELSLIPPLAQFTQQDENWHVLSSNSWISLDNMTLSTTTPVQQLTYYRVEYIVENSLQSSILLLSPPPSNQELSYGLPLNKVLHILIPDIPSNTVIPTPSTTSKYPYFWSTTTQSWSSFSLLYTIPFGSPQRLSVGTHSPAVSTKSKFRTNLLSQQEAIGHLVNDEYLESAWRLSFRMTDSGKELELMIGLDNNGLQDGYTISSNSIPSSYQKQLQEKFNQIQVGEYFWIWFDTSVAKTENYLKGHTTNLLLKCLTRGNDMILFEYFHSDRRDAMSRTMLSHSTSYLIAKRLVNSSSTFPYQLFLDNQPIHLLTLFTIGSNPVQWIVDYLIAHEDALAPNLSSCFMYHAGTTIPQQLIYAAEIICFLLGAKPITMIQYSSSSDHQWKFPLVTQLTKGILLGKLIYSSDLSEVQSQINNYGKDQTLLFYRNTTEALVQLLLPTNTAQALHIVPYPSESDGTSESMNRLLHEQIFNSWWNGYLLGYPDYMIDSYCHNFHSDLSNEEKIQETKRAKSVTMKYFQQNNQKISRKNIKIGNERNLLNEKIINFLSSLRVD